MSTPPSLSSSQPWLDRLYQQQRLNVLALSHNGFVFDPMSGQSFTVNPSGIILLQQLQSAKPLNELIVALTRQFAVDADCCAIAIERFVQQLQAVLL